MKQQLYIKNKGKYEPYRPPEIEVDHKLYRKINGRYYAWEMDLRNEHLPEGVWVITRHKSCTSFTNGKYIREEFRLDKASDIKKISLSELGGLEKLTREVMESLPDNYRLMSARELIYMVVGKIYELNKKSTNDTP